MFTTRQHFDFCDCALITRSLDVSEALFECRHLRCDCMGWISNIYLFVYHFQSKRLLVNDSNEFMTTSIQYSQMLPMILMSIFGPF